MVTPTRRVHLWLKHSLTTISSEAQTNFQKEGGEKDFGNDTIDFPVCRNIDDALDAFGFEVPHFCPPLPPLDGDENEADTNSIEDQHDWLLDGHRDTEYHAERSRELLKELQAPDIEDVVTLRDPILGRQDLQFASFPQSPSATSMPDEDDFGDFQDAEADDAAEVESSNDADDFGDFQEAAEDKKEGASAQSKSSPLHPTELSSQERIPAEENIVEEKKDAEEVVVEDPDGAGEPLDAELSMMSDEMTDDIPHEVGESLRQEMEGMDVLSCSAASLVAEPESDDELRQMDVSTPEGRFLRRLAHEKASPESVSLPQHFYEEESTLCEDVLRSFPWKNVPMMRGTKYRNTQQNMSSEEDMEVVEDHLMDQLMQLDGWLATVTTESLRQLSARRSSLDLCNQHLRELHHSLAMADMYAKRSKESIREARGSEGEFTGLTSGLMLIEAWDRRDDYREMNEMLNSCAVLMEQEEDLQRQIQAFGQDTSRFEEILEAARVFTASAHKDEQLSKLAALEDLRERADRVLDTFANQVESVLVEHLSASCVSWKSFCSTEYSNLLKAMRSVRTRQGEAPVLAEKWSKCILDTLLFEADKSFSRALLDPTNGLDSDHDRELLELAYALKEGHGDFAKLKTVSHNLVTIRFDFEAEQNYLPMVYHRLCLLLTDVLYCHFVLVQWHEEHEEEDKEFSIRINRLLLKSRAKLWKRCEQVLVNCLEEYLNFATKKKLFEDKSDVNPWLNDLEGMHDIFQLTQQFSRVGKAFMGKDAKKVTCLLDDSPDSPLRSKLLAVFKKHLRMVHVETMNSTGFMLSKESWQLVPLDPIDQGLTGFCSSETEFKTYLTKLVADKVPKPSFTERLWHNRARLSKDTLFSSFAKKGNPFDILEIDNHDEEDDDDFMEMDNLEWTSPERVDDADHKALDGLGVYGLVASMADNNLTADSRIAVNSCFKGFAKSMARLLLVMKRLPLIMPDVSKVLQNVSDLFITTVFRLCTANSVNEKLVLGIDRPTPYQMEFPKLKRKNSGPIIGFGRRGAPSQQAPTRPPQPITLSLEGEICAPLPCEESHVSVLRTYIQGAQASLQGMVKLDMVQGWISSPSAISPEESEEEYLCKVCTALEKRQAAAWSCLFVAAMLDLVKNFAIAKLTKGGLAQLLGESKERVNALPLNGVEVFAKYADTILQIAPMIVRYSTRVACSIGIGSRRIVEEICRTSVWDTTELSESSNYYVDLVCGRYAFLWRFLSTSAKLPTGVRSHTWENVVAIGFMTFLEGFARVPVCSTEGRSLMSMDLAAFGAGTSPSSIHEKMDLDVIPKPPRVDLTRGRPYVDTYIKVSYYPQEDMMNWIATNHTTYQYNHCLVLTNGRPELMKTVQTLYMGGEDGEHQQENKNGSLEHRSVEC